jgi:hypothetical protein
LLGATQISIAILCWLVRNAPQNDERRAVVVFLCFDNAIGFIIMLLAQLSGGFSSLGWLPVLIMLFFTIAFGYVGLLKPRRAMEAA